jgi:hypothetical protein
MSNVIRPVHWQLNPEALERRDQQRWRSVELWQRIEMGRALPWTKKHTIPPEPPYPWNDGGTAA